MSNKQGLLYTSISKSIKFLFCHIYTSQGRQGARGAGAIAPAPLARLPLALSLYLAGHTPLRFVGRLACNL